MGALSLESCLKPFIILLAIFGLHVPTGKIKMGSFDYGGCAWILFVFGGFLLLSNIGYWVYASIVTLNLLVANGIGVNGTDLAFAQRAGLGINWFNTATFTGSVHLSLFITIWLYPTDWKRIWITLQEIHINFNLEVQFYRHIRNFVWALFFFYYILDAVYFGVLSYKSVVWLWNIEWLHPLYLAMLNLTHLIAMAIRCLLIVLLFCACNLFAHLNRRLQSIIYRHHSNSYQIGIVSADCGSQKSINIDLEKWMKHYLIVCRFVQSVNSCFDFIILVSVGNAFVSFITYFYGVSDGIAIGVLVISMHFVLLFVEAFLNIFIFIYFTQKLKSEVCFFL